jgi:hypothetical protein
MVNIPVHRETCGSTSPCAYAKTRGSCQTCSRHDKTTDMSDQRSVGEFVRQHWRAELAGTILAAGAAALIGARAVRNHRRTRMEDEALLSNVGREDMQAKLEALNDPYLSRITRERILDVAARVYLATHYSEAHVITPTALLEQFDAEEEAVTAATLEDLEDRGLIAQRYSSVDTSQADYFAEVPLSWAIADADTDVVPGLREAVATVLYGVGDAVGFEFAGESS